MTLLAWFINQGNPEDKMLPLLEAFHAQLDMLSALNGESPPESW